MIDTAAPAQEPEQQPEPVQQEPEPQQVAVVDDSDAAIDAQIDAQAIEVPDGDKLVPLSAVTRLREKLKDARAGTQDAATLRQQLDQATAQLQAVAPLAQAFQAIQQAQQQQQPVRQELQAPTENVADLEEIAKDFDFYKTDGALDLDRARRHQGRIRTEATRIAQEQTAPLVHDRISQAVDHNIARALATAHPVTGEKVDAAILNSLVAQIRRQPGGDRTLADPESMKQVLVNAFGLASFKAVQQAQQQVAQQPATQQAAPLLTERSGGRQANQVPSISAAEKRAAKDAGMTEKEYMDIAAKMPW